MLTEAQRMEWKAEYTTRREIEDRYEAALGDFLHNVVEPSRKDPDWLVGLMARHFQLPIDEAAIVELAAIRETFIDLELAA